MNKYLWLMAFAFLFPAVSFAEEPATYAPEHCEFSVTFPGKTYRTRRCEEGGPDRCYEQISFTQVYSLAATVNFRVICNPVDESVRKNYSGKIMEATLRAMTSDTVVKEFDTSFREEEHYKQAGLIGEGKVGRTPTIYIAQLWIGERSSLSVEAELIGEPNDEADQLFSDVLKSIHYVTEEGPKKESTPGPESESAPP